MHRKIYKTCRNLLTSKRNVVILTFMVLWVLRFLPGKKTEVGEMKVAEKKETKRIPIANTLSVVVVEYEDFDNRLPATIRRSKAADMPAYVVADELPYPPVKLPEGTKVITTHRSPGEVHWTFEDVIRTSHVAIIPDGCYPSRVESLTYMSQLGEETEDVKAIAAPCSLNNKTKKLSMCQGLSVDLRKWALTYFDSNDFCDSLTIPVVLVISSKDLFSLPYPFTRPVQDAIFIQFALRKWKIGVFEEGHFVTDATLYKDPHIHWKHKFKQIDRLKAMYKLFGIKLVQSADGREQYYGCTRQSARCFGTVVNETPDFLTRGKWTPPCCLKGLRTTGKYVFNILQSQGVRFWLEGGSLLGAARNGDIIPWDYDIDIGIYKEDIPKSVHLTQCRKGTFVDDEGFVWDKSQESEGDFFRVQYSETNHLHVDIFPFYSKNGIMTKDTWMKSHKQDTEFPEHYLKPLTTIDFIGMPVSAPNNWKQFLEYKFGKNVIDKPEYPNKSFEFP